jgi:hypothetical protein
MAFYEAAAQVIPLLILAAAVETRFLQNLRPLAGRQPGKKELISDAFLLPLAVLVMISGELAALHVTLVGEATGLEQRLTGLAILAGAFGVATPILNTIIATTTKNLEPYGEGCVKFARRTGVITMEAIHLGLVVLAGLVLAGQID